MRNLLIPILFLCLTTAYSQNEYPKIIQYQGETLVLITMDQVDSLNITYATVDEYKELNDSLKSTIQKYELVITKDKDIIKELEGKNKLHDDVVKEKNTVIEEYKSDNKKLKNKNKRLKILNKVLTVTTTILGVAIAILVL